MKLPDFVDKHYKFDRLSMKTAVFMDKVYKNDDPSTEHSVSVDGFFIVCCQVFSGNDAIFSGYLSYF